MSKLQYGRQRIILDYDEITPSNLHEVMSKALGIHNANARDCDYLINYLLGDQDILNRVANTTNNINNQVVVNHAYPITREIVGYTFGKEFEFIPKNMEKQDAISKLSDIYNYETSYYVDICSALYASTCGVSYQITLPSEDINKDNTPDIPIVYDYLDPRYTFVVQSPRVGNPVIMSCHYTNNKVTNKKDYICYTNKYKFEFTNMDMSTLKVSRNPLGINPITMVENSVFLTGDWEQAISVMNASNQVASDSLNDIEATIKSLLVIIGAEFDNDEDINRVKNNRVLTLTKGGSETSANLDAKFINSKLESTSVQNIRDYLEDARNVITGIPDRSANSSGGDTGTAVLNRDGWTDIEIVARLKALFFKRAKKQQISVGLKILKMLGKIDKDLSMMDMDLSIDIHSNDNLQTKSQAFATLVATGELAVIDALKMVNLTNKPSEVVARGEEAKKQRQEDAIKMAKEAAEASGEGDSSKNGANKTAEIEKAASGNE